MLERMHPPGHRTPRRSGRACVRACVHACRPSSVAVRPAAVTTIPALHPLRNPTFTRGRRRRRRRRRRHAATGTLRRRWRRRHRPRLSPSLQLQVSPPDHFRVEGSGNTSFISCSESFNHCCHCSFLLSDNSSPSPVQYSMAAKLVCVFFRRTCFRTYLQSHAQRATHAGIEERRHALSASTQRLSTAEEQ